MQNELEVWQTFELEIKELEEVQPLIENDEIAEKELENKIIQLEEKIKKEELKSLLSGKYDKSWVIMTILAGQGGRDAEDFAMMLVRMYTSYFEKQKWQYKILHQHFSEEPGGSNEAGGERGYKNITLEVETNYAYGYLKNEGGVHRLVRVSPFDAKQLRHTSFALVEVVPEIKELELNKIELDDKDLKVDFAKSSGPGGQNVNKRETAVRIVHLPTGLAVSCQSERSQAQNREKALHLLKLKIFNYWQKQKATEKEFLRKKIEPSWGNQIRNYVLHPYKLVKDTRTGVETNQIDDVLNGEIEDFIQAGLALKEEK